jgi:hypothetical protein
MQSPNSEVARLKVQLMQKDSDLSELSFRSSQMEKDREYFKEECKKMLNCLEKAHERIDDRLQAELDATKLQLSNSEAKYLVLKSDNERLQSELDALKDAHQIEINGTVKLCVFF